MSRRALSLLAVSIVVTATVIVSAEHRSRTVNVASDFRQQDESEVRDRDINFYSARVSQDPSSAIDRFALARLLFARSRNTGS
ncbi:MAG TPA: hypothetical protein VNC11_13030, partial [Gemmatimonadaceae bacterium]|nr:hypothetical protein [Gemmatimonadaceae bacterium]